ncbi:MAG: DUF885 domain-containing protein [Candidatus Bathyarchaeia archaeon]
MGDSESFDRLAEELFYNIVKMNPIFATYVGLHQYDQLMPDGRKDAIYKRMKLFKEYLDKFEGISQSKLDFERRIDLALVKDFLHLALFCLEEWPLWRMFPDAPDTIGDALFPLLVRNFAPLEIRLRSITERLKNSPRYIEETKSCLEDPVKIYCEISLDTAERLPLFLEQIVEAARGVNDNTKSEVEDAAEKVKCEFLEYKEWLRCRMKDARDDFAIGPERFEKLLALRGLGMSSSEILKLGEKYFRQEKENLRRYAEIIKPGASVDEVRSLLKSHHPKSFGEALEAYRKEIKRAREFVVRSKFASIPENEELIVIETPPFLRSTTPFAAYFSPAKFEDKQLGIYIVTPPASEEMLKEKSYYAISNTTVHEAYPGHHLQLSCANRNSSLVRLLFHGTDFVEGWAHYCEEAVKELGYDDTPEHRFIQTLDMVWRAARIIIDVKLSRGEMGFMEAVNFLVEEVGMAREGAVAEIKRYTYTPSYQLSYLLGKYLIGELKRETLSKLGDRFDLRWFHDTLLYAGSMPLKYHRLNLLEKIRQVTGGA